MAWPCRALPGLALLALAGACSGPAAPSCPSDLPQACPTPEPSYRNDIAPLIQARCYPCHDTGGVEGTTHNLTTWANVYAQRTAVLDQVYACLMPPRDAPQPSEMQRLLLLGWLVCNAPNN